VKLIVTRSGVTDRRTWMDRQSAKMLLCLSLGFGALGILYPSVARAEPPLTNAPGCVKRGWPSTVTCGSAQCFVSSCGEGKCPYCFIEEMKNLVVRGWAVYTCTSGESVTGKALLFRVLPFDARVGPFCG
jgi:hypothetical protein